MPKSARKLSIFLSVAIVVLLWLSVGHGLLVPGSSDNLEGGLYAATGAECYLDPICGAPDISGSQSAAGGLTNSHWHGARYIANHVETGNVARTFSPWSWVILTTMTIFPAALISRRFGSGSFVKPLLVLFLGWYTLKALGGLIVLVELSGMYGTRIPLTDWGTWLVVCLTIAPLVSFAVVGARVRDTTRLLQEERDRHSTVS